MLNFKIVLRFFVLVSLSCCSLPLQALSPYAHKVLEYRPAPGQFINEAYPAYQAGETYEDMLKKASSVLVGRKESGIVCLGSWGGYIVLGFDHAVQNKADTVDFKVYGNAHNNSAEPGIVSVSKDVNANGLADDPWYELAGSAFHTDSTITEYLCTYYRPSPADADVLWRDNAGDSGYIRRNNAYHSQASYYPLWVEQDSLTFGGSRLLSKASGEGSSWISTPYAWGYADNWPNNHPGADFDIDWAVDGQGQALYLDEIHFVRIQTAVQEQLGWLGEVSTEISGIEDLHTLIPNLGTDQLEIQYLSAVRQLYVQAPPGSRLEVYNLKGIRVFSQEIESGIVLNNGIEELVLVDYFLDFLPQNVYLVRLSGSWGSLSSKIL
ncbi:MAG: hypothetical protein PHF38_04030 [Bacteroidales bacterium]|nr:hypothetical protein [Bacteroidales bacterium]MDD4361128.1 hypothetical protein [Bacteroidales bacterium]MDD4429868.1 hypothetical protein [Bacteroidales bacterium]